MQKPQLENGYTKIANELLEALAGIRIPGEQRQVFDVIMRKTYGFKKKEDCISLNQFVFYTKINKRNVLRAIDGLIQKRLIVVKKDNKPIHKYLINKHLNEWKSVVKKDTVVKKDNKPLSILRTSVVNNDNASITKESIKRNNQKKCRNYNENSDQIFLSKLLFDLIKTRYDKAKRPDFQSWALHVDNLMRIDKATPSEINKVIEWCQQDSFWKNQILSTKKLRLQFTKLNLLMNGTPEKPPTIPTKPHIKNPALERMYGK